MIQIGSESYKIVQTRSLLFQIVNTCFTGRLRCFCCRFTQTRSTYRTDGSRAATFFQNVAFYPSHFNEKRSSPLISTRALSSEGLCSSHLALLRQLTSALFPTSPARLLQSFRLRFACTPASQQTRSTYRTYGPRAATFFQNVAFIPRTLMKSGQAL